MNLITTLELEGKTVARVTWPGAVFRSVIIGELEALFVLDGLELVTEPVGKKSIRVHGTGAGGEPVDCQLQPGCSTLFTLRKD